MVIVEAIIKGERNPENFLVHVDRCIRADKETIIKSLEGNWRSEQLYLLEDCYRNYHYYKERIAACDAAMEKQLQHYLKELFPTAIVDEKVTSTKRATKNKPKFNTCSYLKAIYGVDIMSI